MKLNAAAHVRKRLRQVLQLVVHSHEISIMVKRDCLVNLKIKDGALVPSPPQMHAGLIVRVAQLIRIGKAAE